MNNILLGIFFLILGLLFSNMLTKFCGCRDLVEGQCDTASDNCKWDFNQCLPRGDFSLIIDQGTATSVQDVEDNLNNLCKNATPISTDSNFIGYTTPDESSDSPMWYQSNCCQPETTVPTPPADPSPGSYTLSCANDSNIIFTPS